MKQKILILTLLFWSLCSMGQPYRIQVTNISALSGGNTYTLNESANPLQFQTIRCAFGTNQPQNSTSYQLDWYYNTVNSTVGGTLINSGTHFTIPDLISNETKTFVPPTNITGTRYYYAVLSNGEAGCGFTNTLTSNTQQVNVVSTATHLNFDGVNDRVELPNESLYDFTNAMTVEVWMNSNVMPEQWDPLITKGDNSWRLHLNSTGTVDFTCTGTSGGGAVSTTSITDGNWHHVAGVYNGTSLKIYIDGVLENQVAATGSISNSIFPVYIGNNSDYTVRFYTGNIDEVRIWNIGRSAEQINGSKNCELNGSETGLVSYFKFNQGIDAADNTAITSLTDATANANNGTLINFTKTGTTSNFLAGSPIVTGTNCAVLSNESFEVANNIKIYPNPTNGIFAIETQEDSTVEVFDMIGKKVYSNKVSVGSSTIDLSNYTNGIYLLTVTNQKGNLNTFKLIKQ